MTDLVVVRSFTEAAQAAAAVDAGALAHDAVLLVARTGPVPEVMPRLQASPAFAPIRSRFDTVADLNDIIEPAHPLAHTLSDREFAALIHLALAGRSIDRVVAAVPELVPRATRSVPVPSADAAGIVAEALGPLSFGRAPDALVLGCAPGTSGAEPRHAALVAKALTYGPRVMFAPHPDAAPASLLEAEAAAAKARSTLEVLDPAIPRELALAAWPHVPTVRAEVGTPPRTAAPRRRSGPVRRRLETARALMRAYTYRP